MSKSAAIVTEWKWNFKIPKLPSRRQNQKVEDIAWDCLNWCLTVLKTIDNQPVLKLILERKITTEAWSGTEEMNWQQFMNELQNTDERLTKAGAGLQAAYKAEIDREVSNISQYLRSSKVLNDEFVSGMRSALPRLQAEEVEDEQEKRTTTTENLYQFVSGFSRRLRNQVEKDKD